MQEAERHGGPTRLGSYEIVRPLARGGMAELFLARVAGPQTFEKLVVVKKILPKFADNPRFVQLFFDEAKLAASLSHKNIVSVHDVGGSGAESFFAMEYLHGQDVRSILHRTWKTGEKLPITHAVQIGSQVAAALHYAHEKRRPDGSLVEIVHRDVSPSNVIVSYDGAVKLVDFGVAKAATRTVKTRTGTLKGKIAYMSPEQAKGAAIDRRSDVFSLGIVLWEMVTTTRLFRGENDLATLQLIINNPIKRPSEERPDCPPELERIILKALSQDASRRYQSANEVVQELEDFVRTEQLQQSAASLSAYMSGLFRAELESWEVARAQGMALGDHLTNVGELTTPVSESDFVEPIDSVDLEEDEELEESLGAVSGQIDPPTSSATIPGRRMNTPPAGQPVRPPEHTPPPQLTRPSRPTLPPASPPAKPRSANPGDQTPPPQLFRQSGPIPSIVVAQPRADLTPVPIAAAGGRGDSTELVKPLPPPVRPPQDSSPWPASVTPSGGIAQGSQGSWPQGVDPVSLGAPGEQLFSPEQAHRLRKQFVWGGSILIGLVLIIAIAKGGGEAETHADPRSAGSAAMPSDDEAPPQDERAKAAPSSPTAPTTPNAATTPTDAGVPVASPPDAAITAVPPDAAVQTIAKPPAKKPPGKRPPGKRPPVKKLDPNAPLPPR